MKPFVHSLLKEMLPSPTHLSLMSAASWYGNTQSYGLSVLMYSKSRVMCSGFLQHPDPAMDFWISDDTFVSFNQLLPILVVFDYNYN